MISGDGSYVLSSHWPYSAWCWCTATSDHHELFKLSSCLCLQAQDALIAVGLGLVPGGAVLSAAFSFFLPGVFGRDTTVQACDLGKHIPIFTRILSSPSLIVSLCSQADSIYSMVDMHVLLSNLVLQWCLVCLVVLWKPCQSCLMQQSWTLPLDVGQMPCCADCIWMGLVDRTTDLAQNLIEKDVSSSCVSIQCSDCKILHGCLCDLKLLAIV